MTIHRFPIPPLTIVDTSTIINPPPPIHLLLYKPPPPQLLASSYPTFTSSSTPQFQTLAASSSSSDRSCSEVDSSEPDPDPNGGGWDEIEVEIEKVSNNRRRIRSKVSIEASLETVWGILTDYERLADVIPSLVVSQVLDKRINFARLLQIGQQNLAFGLKFSAKGVVDCYERDFEVLPNGGRRDIDFKMIEGDFELFEGKWSIEQYEQSGFVAGQRYDTTLVYTVEVQPKLWLPVRLVEGRISREIQMNLFSIREEARNLFDSITSE